MDYQKISEIMKALSHPTRLQIVEYLAEGEKCVKDIWEELDIPQPTASQHINVLKNAGVICYKKEGVRTCYRIKDERVVKILNILKEEEK
ncbi:ArsR/SmtB family transcription factor [Desulfurobacterium atlanticum]|uniref:Transcriptional regulator, ArsR family n=1 Tax=Desulfurobacterium atlanticum TaxID=240169 RepID=A0A238ZZ73_9BACT|nr:metalloregulator ArsR/SmtB family transcription factor [Desulfurobacterium atlanticum]SNR88084.1 transcriptional regulator, ArsR family [Desulfurobacterium atlanticum]